MKPEWLKLRVGRQDEAYNETAEIVRAHGIRTICVEGACPNIHECWRKRHAAFMILGDICTRCCMFCNIRCGVPAVGVSRDEPERLAKAVQSMGLSHVVITSVTRDDLHDGGAGQFVACIRALRSLRLCPSIEVLTPDFYGKVGALEDVVRAKPDIFNHNLETVPSLYRVIKPGSCYDQKLDLLRRVKDIDSGVFTKSGIMLGLGETQCEVEILLDDLRAVDVDFITIGQYLQPSPTHAEVRAYITPEEFAYYGEIARSKGFKIVSSTPFTRSSYHADSLFAKFKEKI